jgi:peptidoglycan hydrolase CwlO-like protein
LKEHVENQQAIIVKQSGFITDFEEQLKAKQQTISELESKLNEQEVKINQVKQE